MNDQQQSRADALTITEDERDGNWYEFAVNGHGGLIRVVARMEDADEDYPLGKRVRDFLLAASPVEQPAAAPIARNDPNAVTRLKAICRKLGLESAFPDEVYSDPEGLFVIFGRVREAIDRIVQPAPSPADERAAYEIDAEDARAIIDAGHAIPEHWRVKAEHIVSMDRDPAKREEAGKTAVMLLRVLLKDPQARAASANETGAEGAKPPIRSLEAVRADESEHQRFRYWQQWFVNHSGHPMEPVDAWQMRATLDAGRSPAAEAREEAGAAPWPGCSHRVCNKGGACWDQGKCLEPCQNHDPHAASVSETTSDTRIARLRAAIEGECDGLHVDYHHAKAILAYLDDDGA